MGVCIFVVIVSCDRRSRFHKTVQEKVPTGHLAIVNLLHMAPPILDRPWNKNLSIYAHICFIENLCRYSFTLSCTLVHARSRIPERVKSTEYYSNGYYTNPSPTLGWIKPMATSCLLSNSENWIKRLHVKTDSLTKPTKKRNSSVRGRLDVGSIKKSRRPDKAWPCAKKG